jgi:3D (Asp-Asp-Asp) domain-containing protein
MSVETHNINFSETELNNFLGKLDSPVTTYTFSENDLGGDTSQASQYPSVGSIYNAIQDIPFYRLRDNSNRVVNTSDQSLGDTALGGTITGQDDKKIPSSKLVADRGVIKSNSFTIVRSNTNHLYYLHQWDTGLTNTPSKIDVYLKCHTTHTNYFSAGDVLSLDRNFMFVLLAGIYYTLSSSNTYVANFRHPTGPLLEEYPDAGIYLDEITVYNTSTNEREYIVPTSDNYELFFTATL